MPMADYLRLPTFSSSLVSAIVDRCPAAAWFESYLNPKRRPDADDEAGDEGEDADDDNTHASDLGTVAHSLLLEDDRSKVVVLDPREFVGKRGGIPKGFTNEAIRAARDEAQAAGKTPILLSRMIEAEAMAAAGRAFIGSLRDTEPAVWRAFQRDAGFSELTMIWNDDGIPCRLRADRIASDYSVIVDAKFTGLSAHPDAWGRSQLSRMGYHRSAAFYRRGVEAQCGVQPAYLFLVVETAPPYLCALVGLEPQTLELAAQQCEYALGVWRDCIAADHWPGYPTRAAYPELPAWEFARWQERMSGDEQHGHPFDLDQVFKRKEAA